MPAPTRARRARKAARRQKPTRSLTCHKCGADEESGLLHVERMQNRVKYHGTQRTAVNVICHSDDCLGREFRSVHPRALAIAQAADAEARG